mgnify:CR=1 FL=1
MLLHFGPQHPSTHGVFRMDLFLDGEIVVKVVPHCGYLHRAVEKLCERLAYVQSTPIVDKNDYVSPMTNEQALNAGFEKLLGVEVPRRGHNDLWADAPARTRDVTDFLDALPR